MKIMKSLKTFFMTLMIIMLTGTVAFAADIEISTSIASGSTLSYGTNVDIITKSNIQNVGIKKINYSLKNSSGTVETEKETITDYTYGASAYSVPVRMPSKEGTYSLNVTATNINSGSYTQNFTFNVKNESANVSTGESKISFSSVPVTGSNIDANTKAKVTAVTNSSKKGIRTIGYEMFTSNGQLIARHSATSQATLGNSPLDYSITMPKINGTYKVVVTATDIDGKSKSATFYFKVINGTNSSTSTPSTTTTSISIKTNKKNKADIAVSSKIEVTATTDNSSVGIKKVMYEIITSVGQVIARQTKESSSSNGVSPFTFDVTMPSVEGIYTLKITATDSSNRTRTESFEYTVDEDKDEDDDDDKVYSGVIDPELEDLTVDLWIDSKETFFELEDEIEFYAYYYNSEKKDKKNVVIEVEIPDGFKLVDRDSEQGKTSYSNDTLKFKLGTVESKQLGYVTFTLEPNDDDVTGEITDITATIFSDTDDEEDSSTQKIWVYETGDKGNFKAYVTGYRDGTFRPDSAITREEVAAMMARAFGYSVFSNIKKFNDVKLGSWAYNYIIACSNRNVITGYSDGTFKPYNNITRAELYAMVFRALDIDTDEKSLFIPKEYKKDDSWEKNYVAGLERLRMFKDMDETATDEYATRADVVYLINRIQFRNPGSASGTYSDTNGHWALKDIESASKTYSYKRTSSGKESIIK